MGLPASGSLTFYTVGHNGHTEHTTECASQEQLATVTGSWKKWPELFQNQTRNEPEVFLAVLQCVFLCRPRSEHRGHILCSVTCCSHRTMPTNTAWNASSDPRLVSAAKCGVFSAWRFLLLKEHNGSTMKSRDFLIFSYHCCLACITSIHL